MSNKLCCVTTEGECRNTAVFQCMSCVVCAALCVTVCVVAVFGIVRVSFTHSRLRCHVSDSKDSTFLEMHAAFAIVQSSHN